LGKLQLLIIANRYWRKLRCFRRHRIFFIVGIICWIYPFPWRWVISPKPK